MYCRNSNGAPNIWCYTTDPDKVWEYCATKGNTKEPKIHTCPTEGIIFTRMYYTKAQDEKDLLNSMKSYMLKINNESMYG